MDELTSAQLSEWEAYDRIDPIGTFQSSYHAAYIAMLIINTTRAVHGKKGIKMDSILDHMPFWMKDDLEPEIKKQSTEEMKQILLGIASAQNKKIANKNRPPTLKKK